MSTFLPPQATKRLMREMQAVEELKQQGIWYVQDEVNFTKGTAMIRGPAGTPYADALLFFSVEFPADYPFSPPRVLILTSDGVTRFHPNLYVQGKVCLSILGTYSGPQWSGALSFNSVLLSILGLLDNNPLAHEPAWEKGTLVDPKHSTYAECVEHQMIKYMVELIKKFESPISKKGYMWEHFEEEIQGLLPELKENLRKRIQSHTTETVWSNLPYGMNIRTHWSNLKIDL
jgi:ubiquitin-conjugating enzyme E2 Z